MKYIVTSFVFAALLAYTFNTNARELDAQQAAEQIKSYAEILGSSNRCKLNAAKGLKISNWARSISQGLSDPKIFQSFADTIKLNESTIVESDLKQDCASVKTRLDNISLKFENPKKKTTSDIAVWMLNDLSIEPERDTVIKHQGIVFNRALNCKHNVENELLSTLASLEQGVSESFSAKEKLIVQADNLLLFYNNLFAPNDPDIFSVSETACKNVSVAFSNIPWPETPISEQEVGRYKNSKSIANFIFDRYQYLLNEYDKLN